MSSTRTAAWIVAAVAALGLIGPAAAQEAGQAPARYLRVQVSPECLVYVQFQGESLRAATSVAGLSAAEPVLMLGDNGALESPDFPLPVPSSQLPAGITAVKARFGFILLQAFGVEEKTPARICGDIELCRTDERRAEWALVKSFEAQPAAEPEKAPAIVAPSREKPALAIVAAPAGERLSVCLRLAAGGETVSNVRKDGKSILAAEVWVLDATGQQVTFQRGRLADFGFQASNAPNYSVEMEKGDYTVEARLNAGPFGMFKAEAEVTLPKID